MQTRYIRYRDPITSFEANEKYAGIIAPTVYKGFDIIASRSGALLTIGHTVTGEVFTKKDGTTTNPRGIWVSNQGIVVKEDEPIQLSIESNGSNNYERWDLLVAEHSYDELSEGGLPASYSVIKGGNKADPVLPSANYQTVIGRFKIPAGAAGTTAVTYERVRTPQLGGKFSAILNEVNRFENQIQESHGIAQLNVEQLELSNRGVIKILEKANTFLVNNTAGAFLDLLPDLPIGTSITLIFSNSVTIRQIKEQRVVVGNNELTAGYAAGYRPLSFSSGNQTAQVNLNRGDSITVTKTQITTGAQLPNADYWVVNSASSITGTVYEVNQKITSLTARVETLETGLGTTNGNITAHIQNTNNPHGVTKTQVGLSNIPNAKSDSVTLADSNSLATSMAVNALRAALNLSLTTHEQDKNNPHGVTKAQVGLANIPDAVSSDITSNSNQVLATTQLTFALYQMLSGVSGVPAGTIVMWNGAAVPAGWVVCDGQNGTPDLRGRSPLGATADSRYTPDLPTVRDDGGRSETILIGSKRGYYYYKMTKDEMPQHSHELIPDNKSSGGALWGPSTRVGKADRNSEAYGVNEGQMMRYTRIEGNSQAHMTIHPVIGVLFIMKL